MRGNRSSDLTVPQLRTLTYIYRGNGGFVSELAEHLGLTLPSTSVLVDGLVKRGILSRSPVQGDRRRIRLELTEAGNAILKRAQEHTQAHFSQILCELPIEDQETVAKSLRILRSLFTSQPIGKGKPAR
jgi:DNA-binding MarR family transcriptional regulator